MYIINVYLCSMRPDVKNEWREETREERALLPPALGSYKNGLRLQCDIDRQESWQRADASDR